MSNIISSATGTLTGLNTSVILPVGLNDLRICRLLMILDASGSECPHEAVIYNSVCDTLTALAKKNATSEDMTFEVKIVVFNESVQELSSEFLPPEQVLELFDRSAYNCSGSTNLGGIIDYLDKQYTRSNTTLCDLHSGDPRPMNLLITDMMGTDSVASRHSSMDKLLRNQLFKQSVTLCAYNGPAHHKTDAVQVAGEEGNIIAIDGDLSTCLTPVLLTSTLTLTDATHLGGNEQSTPAAVAEAIIQRSSAGSSDAGQLTSQEVQDELNRMLGLA